MSPIDRLFALTVVLVGFILGARPVTDNSTFVHLRTGIDIVNGAGIPRTDPYSLAAKGTTWVVQSWLPSLLYGLTFNLDDGLFVLLQGALTAAIALVIVALAGPAGTPLRRAGAALLAMSVGGLAWSPRPLLFGLLCLGLTVLAVERDWPWWSHLIIGWVWVNSHGSFPLGLLWIAATAAGSIADERRLVTDRVRRIGPIVGGLLLGAVNPLGARLLLFPLALGERREVFSRIVEWRSPDFQSLGGLISAMALAGCVVVLTRRRVAWHLVVPAGVFVVAALYASRNLAPLGIVLAPALAAAVAPQAARETRPTAWTTRERFAAALLAAVLLMIVARAAAGPGLGLRTYPDQVVARATEAGWLRDGRPLAHSDVVGCFLILDRGKRSRVFIDDRYDMYPPELADDYFALLKVRGDAMTVLDRRGIEIVLWKRDHGLVTLLRQGGWDEVEGDHTWVVLARPGTRP